MGLRDMRPLFVADDKFPDVIAQLEARGWRRFPHEAFPKFDLKWSNYAKIPWSRVGLSQRVNHFFNAILLSRKDALALRLYASSKEAADTFYPRTVHLVGTAERQTLLAWFLYFRALGVLLHVSRSPEPMHPATATAATFLSKVLELEDFHSLWSSGLDLTALELSSDQWKPLMTPWSSDERPTAVAMARVEQIVSTLRERDPQFGVIEAGRGDVWICKPSNLSQGRGIHLLTDPNALLELLGDMESDCQQENHTTEEAATKASWIVQKYVERPLLIRQRGGLYKFDVRQWVLITSLSPLKIYWHEKCYLRFCSQPFTLNESSLGDSMTHLSNYSIQKNAGEKGGNDDGETFDCMWHSARFQQLLRKTHGRDVWQESIVPQMQLATRQAIHAVLPELKEIGRGFEWLGIDFLIDVAHRVWLLEVNVSPDVSHSTPVTGDLVPDATSGVLDCMLEIDLLNDNCDLIDCLVHSGPRRRSLDKECLERDCI